MSGVVEEEGGSGLSMVKFGIGSLTGGDSMALVPEESICKTCINCMVREVMPLDGDNWDVLMEEDEDSETYFHACCTANQMGLSDHIVYQCNYYEDFEEDEEPMEHIRRFFDK